MAKPPVEVGTRVPSAHLVAEMSAPLQAFVTRALGQIGELGDDEESLWRASDLGERMEMAGRLIAGRANLELGTRVPNLAEELRRRGKTRRAFDQAIEVYKAFDALPAVQQVEALAALGWTKNRAIAGWQEEERIALASGESVRGLTLDDAATMPSREFEAAVRDPAIERLEQQLTVEKRRRETAEANLEAVQNAAQRPGLTKVDAARREVRLSGHGHAELIQLAAVSLARLSETLTEPLYLPTDEHDTLVDKGVCTGLLAEIMAAKAAVDDALEIVRTRLNGRLSQRADDVPMMTAQEARDARDRRAAAAQFSEKERNAAEALAYMRNELDGASGRGAPPAAVKQLRRKGA